MRVKLTCRNTPAGQVTVIRPLVPEPQWPGVIFYASIWFLVEKESISDLGSRGAADGVSFWEAEWVSSTLDAPSSVLRGGAAGGSGYGFRKAVAAIGLLFAGPAFWR